MGIFAWLENQFCPVADKIDSALPEPTRPAPTMPEVKPAKLNDVSEPVISLLESLGRDEWELIGEERTPGFKDSTYLVNVWHEHIFLFVSHPIKYCKKYELFDSDWMTDAERERVIASVINRRHTLEKITAVSVNKMKRGKFMVLVKDKNVQA